MADKTSVLIVGSGPTGLVMANCLKDLEISVRIIDRLPHPRITSRAFTIHARTLELLGQVGLADKFLAKGIKTLTMDYHFPLKDDTPQLDFTQLDSVFPFCLTINQADTEAILRQHLHLQGINVEWNVGLESFTIKDSGGIEAKIYSNDTDSSEIIEADWLIGCDGFASTVRQQLGISLDGDEYGGTMRMMDVRLTGFEPSDTAMHYFVAKEEMVLINKLPGENYRVVISDKTQGVPPEEAKAAFQAILDRRFDGTVKVGDPDWATNFKISKRQVSSYHRGNVFLAGDAAHVNSPAGGQGMNVSMQDAFNLSWKLAMVIKDEANSTLLDSYESERAPIASQMLEGTNYIHSIIMAHGRGMEERIERMRGGEWNKEAVNQVAGISYTYRNRSASDLAVGDRAPDAAISFQNRIYNLINADGYTLFLFIGDRPNIDCFMQLAKLSQTIISQFKAKITPWIIVPQNFASQIAQENSYTIKDYGTMHNLYRVPNNRALFVLRPDCHIDYIGSPEDKDALLIHLSKNLKKRSIDG